MPAPPLTDDELAEAVRAYEEHGGRMSEAAEALGLLPQTLRSRLQRARERGFHHDPAVMDAMQAVGTRMVPSGMWIKTGEDEEGVSRSVYLRPAQEDLGDIAERMREAFEGMKPAEPIQPPASTVDDLLSLYPLMDVHWGMLAWGKETGAENYNVAKARDDLRHAFAKVIALTPDSAEAILLIGGDFFHADDNRSETPASRHKLDTDGRHWKVLDEGVEIVAEAVETLARKHAKVTLRVLRGNHDEHSHLVLTFALAQRYRETDHITVEKDPRDLFMHRWGRCAIFAHHGDKAKPAQLTLYLSDICPFWSETRHRFCFTGHIHHDSAKDLGPLRWESLRAFCPPDAYAASMGYGARRALQSVTFDRTDGIVLRAIDPVERLEPAA